MLDLVCKQKAMVGSDVPFPLIFAGEAGNFDCSPRQGTTSFILATIVLSSPQAALDLEALRWQLARKNRKYTARSTRRKANRWPNASQEFCCAYELLW